MVEICLLSAISLGLVTYIMSWWYVATECNILGILLKLQWKKISSVNWAQIQCVIKRVANLLQIHNVWMGLCMHYNWKAIGEKVKTNYNQSKQICSAIWFWFSFLIIGTYKYCYNGSYLPNCSIDLFLNFAEQRILVQKGLPMDCREYSFNRSFNTMSLQERNYQVYVS